MDWNAILSIAGPVLFFIVMIFGCGALIRGCNLGLGSRYHFYEQSEQYLAEQESDLYAESPPRAGSRKAA